MLSFRTLSLLGITLAVIFLHACSGVTLDNDSPPEVQYAEGERLLKKDRFMESIERFRILKSRYPYSKYAALASLRIGDAHFQEESFPEAAAAYKIFRELYPKHEQAAYALFRIGESHYNLMPSTSDRDLDPAASALEAYNQLLKEYPNDPNHSVAEKRILDLRLKMAQKEEYIADFYYKREQYGSAVGRYTTLLEAYPDFGNKENAMYKLAASLERVGELKKAHDKIETYLAAYPDGHWKKDATNLQKKLNAMLEPK